MDKISTQGEYQKQVFGKDLSSLSDKQRISESNTMILAVIEELMELMSEYKAFEWKKDKTPDIDLIHEEIVDIYHFFMNLCLIWGLNSDSKLEEFYIRKLSKNYERGGLHNDSSHTHK
jgi:dimeric dUTPase (all-alpha-NTP-PPase superfamily)